MTTGSAPKPHDPRDSRTSQATNPTSGAVDARLQEILSRHPGTLSEEVGILEQAHRLLHDALA